jgi:hypothetical protein
MGRFFMVILGRQPINQPIAAYGWIAASARLDQSLMAMREEATKLNTSAASAGVKLRESMIRCMAALLN